MEAESKWFNLRASSIWKGFFLTGDVYKIQFCDNCNNMITFKKIDNWDHNQNRLKTSLKGFCTTCGILDDPIDFSSYKTETT